MKALRSTCSFEGFGVSSPFDPNFYYVTSPVFSPVTLGALRLLFAVYALITTITTLAFSSLVFNDSDSSVPLHRRRCGNELIISNTGTFPTLRTCPTSVYSLIFGPRVSKLSPLCSAGERVILCKPGLGSFSSSMSSYTPLSSYSVSLSVRSSRVSCS